MSKIGSCFITNLYLNFNSKYPPIFQRNCQYIRKDFAANLSVFNDFNGGKINLPGFHEMIREDDTHRKFFNHLRSD